MKAFSVPNADRWRPSSFRAELRFNVEPKQAGPTHENNHRHRGLRRRIAAAGLGLAATAPADPLTGNAADVVKMLQDQGYDVQFNMPSEMALSRCTISGVHGLTVMMTTDGDLMVMMAPKSSVGSVYVDLSCPPSNN